MNLEEEKEGIDISLSHFNPKIRSSVKQSVDINVLRQDKNIARVVPTQDFRMNETEKKKILVGSITGSVSVDSYLHDARGRKTTSDVLILGINTSNKFENYKEHLVLERPYY
jgi:hypothetical protein